MDESQVKPNVPSLTEGNHSTSLIGRTKRDRIIAILFIAGWVLPSVQTGYGIAFGATGYLNDYSYRVHIFLGECGWFSSGVRLERTLEAAGHGHAWPVGPWYSGYALTFGVALSGVIACYWPKKHRLVILSWRIIRPLLVIMVYYAFVGYYSRWRLILLGVAYAGYFLFGVFQRRRIKRVAEPTASRQLIGLIVLFYPIWVLALCIVQSTIPFIGWVCTLVGCLLLLTYPSESVCGASIPNNVE